MSLLRKITSMIRRATVSLSMSDTGTRPISQVSYLGKTAKIEVIWPYGMNGQLPLDALVLLFNIEAMEENKAGMGNTPTDRLKVDAEGEVSFGNPLTGSVTYYRANGDIEIIGKNDQSITIDKDWNLTATGVVNITAPTINLIGDVSITGDLAVTGTGVFTGALSGEGIDLKTHTHAQGNDSDGDTQVDTGGAL